MTDRHASRDALAIVRTVRPDPDASPEWDTATSTAVLDRILATPRVPADLSPRPRSIGRPRPVGRGRLAAAGLVAGGIAAAVLAGVFLPGGTPGGPDPAAAAELRRLALVAGERGGTVGPDQYAYTAVVEEQTADDLSSPPAAGNTRVGDVDRRPRRDTWLAFTGISYTVVGDSRCLRRSASTAVDADLGDYADLTGAQLAQLPTDAGRLAAFLDAHPSGDNRGTRNRFMSVGDLVRSGLAPPQLRAAALGVLATTGGLIVRTGVRDDRGRPSTTVTQADHGDTAETLYFDPATSAVLEERQTIGDGDGHYTGLVLTAGVADRLPDLPRCASGAPDPSD